MQDVVLLEPRNRLPGTEDSAPQWDLPYDVSHDNSHGKRTSGEVQSARCVKMPHRCVLGCRTGRAQGRTQKAEHCPRVLSAFVNGQHLLHRFA